MNQIAYFLDFEFDTASSTFFPRFETELLVEKAVELLSGRSSDSIPCQILDIGTGCGNIAISLTKYIPSSRIVASDISDAALLAARENAKRHKVLDRIRFMKSDIFENIKEEKYGNYFDLIISNPPYVSLGDFKSLPSEVKHDPYIALYGGRDGLSFYRRIAGRACAYLKKGGVLLMEMGYDQSHGVRDILESSARFSDIELHKDYLGIERIITAKSWTNS